MNAVVTAGASIEGDYAHLAGTSLKALAPIRGKTMLDRTIDALRGAGVERVAVVGNDEVQRAVAGRIEKPVPDRGTGAANVMAALDAWAGEEEPFLYATCDMPFIEAAHVASFLRQVQPDSLAMPLSELDDFVQRFPGAPPFGITLAGQTVINGGVFFIPPGAAERIRSVAAALFDARKAPWKMAQIAGAGVLLKFAFKRLSVADLESRARSILDMNVAAVRGCPPELAYDADVADEYRYACEHE